MTLRHPADDLENRTPVWVAMTDFYLDTELTDVMISYVARIGAASPYSMRELERIMFAEVWPAFLPNLLSYVGEWTGWSEEFVQQRVLECYKPRFYLSWRVNPLKWYFCRKWSTVEKLIVSAHNEQAGQPQ